MIQVADLPDRQFWPGAHTDQRRPLRADSGEVKLLSAVLAAAVTDYLVWSRRLQNPRNAQDSFWLRAQLREVEGWLFTNSDGYGLRLAGEILNFDVEAFRAALKAERMRRYIRILDRPPAPSDRAKRLALRSRAFKAASLVHYNRLLGKGGGKDGALEAFEDRGGQRLHNLRGRKRRP